MDLLNIIIKSIVNNKIYLELITKKKIENLGSLDQLEKEIWKQNIPPEEHQDQEKLLEIVITKTCLYFSYYLFNP